MGIIQFNGRNVYTIKRSDITKSVLENCGKCNGMIFDAYFSSHVLLDQHRRANTRKRFEDLRLDAPYSGLVLSLGSRDLIGIRYFTITNWDNVIEFLVDAGTDASDLSILKNRKIKTYHQNPFLLGISLS